MFVGMDVSKNRLDVHIRPSGEAMSVARDGDGIEELVTALQAMTPRLVVLEATGGFETVVAAAIWASGLPLAVVNPRLIVEVTSPNTEKRDRGVKLDDYRLLPSLREYLIVSHVRREVEIWSRDGAGEWVRRVLTTGQAAELELGVALAVDDLYRDPLPPR